MVPLFAFQSLTDLRTRCLNRRQVHASIRLVRSSHSNKSNPRIQDWGFRFNRGDIRDVGLVKGLVKDVDVVFHEAAIVSVPIIVKDPVLAHDVNVNGTSSCATYGNIEV